MLLCTIYSTMAQFKMFLSSVVLSIFKSGYFIKFGVDIFPHNYPTGFQKQNLLSFFPSCFVLSRVTKLHGQGFWLIIVTELISVLQKRKNIRQNAGEIAQLVVEGLYSIKHSIQEAWDSIPRTTKLDMVVYALSTWKMKARELKVKKNSNYYYYYFIIAFMYYVCL